MEKCVDYKGLSCTSGTSYDQSKGLGQGLFGSVDGLPPLPLPFEETVSQLLLSAYLG